MAAIARRAWSALRDEAILRLGNITATGFSARVEYFMTQAYFDLALMFHHHELDVIDTTKTLSTSNNEVTLPTDTYIVVSVRLKSVAGVILGPLTFKDARSLFDDYTGVTAGQPKSYTRFASKLYVETKPDAAYPLEIFYYQLPTAPDFSSGSPVTGRDMDDHIIERTLQLGWPAIARPDLGSIQGELLTEWLQRQVRSDLVGEPLPAMREKPLSGSSFGGVQG